MSLEIISIVVSVAGVAVAVSTLASEISKFIRKQKKIKIDLKARGEKIHLKASSSEELEQKIQNIINSLVDR